MSLARKLLELYQQSLARASLRGDNGLADALGVSAHEPGPPANSLSAGVASIIRPWNPTLHLVDRLVA